MPIRKYETRCPNGYHKDPKTGQCLDGEGNPYIPTQTFKDPQAVGRFKGTGEDIEFEEEEKKPMFGFTEEQEKKIKQNTKKIKGFIAQMMRDSKFTRKFAPVLLPYCTFLISYDYCTRKSAEIRERAKNELEQEQAEAYQNALDEILKTVPDVDTDMLETGDAVQVVKEVQNGIRTKLNDLKKSAIENGRDSVEYAQYRAYSDYMKMCESKGKILETKLKLQQKKEQESKTRTSVDEQREKFKGKK